jgi:hypothetical protein
MSASAADTGQTLRPIGKAGRVPAFFTSDRRDLNFIADSFRIFAGFR